MSYVRVIHSSISSHNSLKSQLQTIDSVKTDSSTISVPSNGLVSYIGNTTPLSDNQERWGTHSLIFKPASSAQLTLTRLNLFKQWPWKKIKGKIIIKAKIGGEILLESQPSGGLFSLGSQSDQQNLQSISDIQNMFQLAAHDPRVLGVFIEIDRVASGYAKLIEIRRAMNYFRQANKTIYGYCASGSEKEFYLSLGCDEIYIPPEGGFDLRGFGASASFFRGIFDNIGIEPQVQRIGKYKSFGDTFNRTSISEAQREVISALLLEASDYWVDSVSKDLNKSRSDVLSLWSETGVRSSEDLKEKGLVTGVSYVDMVEEHIRSKHRRLKVNIFQKIVSFFTGIDYGFIDNKSSVVAASYNLTDDFIQQPRRSIDHNQISSNSSESQSNRFEDPNALPAGLYLRKLKFGSRIIQGLPLKETRVGPRVAVINAVGGINTGKSGNGPTGKTLGSDSLIGLIREARRDNNIKAVVLRIDSPGGSALASDLMWRELRKLSRDKPVVASQVDVAASGGYYLSMACDQIVSEELSVTGSIGVVTSKFNAAEFNKKIGLNVETISRGRYAEVLSTSRAFTEEEEKYFESGAWQAYESFITKAASSRNMTVEAMNQVAQGRVWTGRQALAIGLVDHIGGLHKSIEVAIQLSNYTFNRNPSSKNIFSIPIQTLREPRSGFPFPLPGASSQSSKSSDVVKYLADEAIFISGLANLESLQLTGLSNEFTWLPSEVVYWLSTGQLPESLLKIVNEISKF
eukprot:gene21366-27679_t